MKKQLFTFIAIALCTLSSHDARGAIIQFNGGLFKYIFTARPKKNDLRLQLAGVELNLSQMANIAMTVGPPMLAYSCIFNAFTGKSNTDILGNFLLAYGAGVISIPIVPFFAYRTLNAEQIIPISFIDDKENSNETVIGI